MKKSLFAIFAVAAIAAGCSKVVESPVLNNEISFDSYVGKDAMTKATVVTGEGITSVNVNAYLHSKETTNGAGFISNFMTNQAVAKDGSYAPAKYWPAVDQAVDFVAWVPVDNATVENATLTFTVPEDVAKQNDLLVATPVLDKNGATEETKTPVNLVFKHLLSRIAFEIIATDIPTDGINVVKLTELSLNGSFAFQGTVDMTNLNPIVVKSGSQVTSKYEMTNYFKYTDGVMTNSEGNLATEYLMIIPDGNAPEYIKVTYTVTTYKVDEDGKATTETLGTPIINTACFALQPSEVTESTPAFAYEPGKAYKYVFSIAMDTISFTVTEEVWDSETSSDIINNYTPAEPEDDTNEPNAEE